MTLASYLIGLLISTLYGALYHLLRGGSIGRLFFYICLGWAGFWIGQWLASVLGWTFLSFGPLHLGMASLLSGIFLFTGDWLSQIQVRKI